MMTARQKPPARAPTPVWERPEPAARAALEPLSRERIVRAAIAIADHDGLSFVSLRHVASALDAGPMRLYGYLSTKEELLDLMVDAVYEEMAPGRRVRGDWKKALRAIAHRMRRAAKDHPWFIDLVGGRPNQGPNALVHLEASLAAVADVKGFEDIDDALLAVGAVNAYVIGAIRSEASELRATSDTGLDKDEWRSASWPYLQRMLATGRFPTIARAVKDAKHPSFEVTFDRGLDCVLNGIEAQIAR